MSVFDPRDQTFRFHEGPIFTHILLADEINRASPRTQSALLEAMAEGQVSVDGDDARACETLFFVIATQNPVEFRGTYPLPEAQMDRFALQFGLGYVGAGRGGGDPLRAGAAPSARRPARLRVARGRAGAAPARAPGPRERRAEALRRRPGARDPHRARRAARRQPARLARR